MKIKDFFSTVKWWILNKHYKRKVYKQNLKAFKKLFSQGDFRDHNWCVQVYKEALKLFKEDMKLNSLEEEYSKNKKLEVISKVINLLDYYDDLESCPTYSALFRDADLYADALYDARMQYSQELYRLLRGVSNTEKSEKIQEFRKKLKDPVVKQEFMQKYGLLSDKDYLYKYRIEVECFDGTGCFDW